MNTPQIDYLYWSGIWTALNNEKVYIDRNIQLYSNFNGTFIEIENEIALITALDFEQLDDLLILRAIDLINQWGGKTSRYFYISKKTLNGKSCREIVEYDENLKKYKDAILAAKSNDPKAADLFLKINGIGNSFKGKHAMFWSQYNLPVIDSKIVGCFCYMTTTEFEAHHTYLEYCNKLRDIKLELNLPLSSIEIERAIFAFHKNYFKNDNSGFSNKIIDRTNLNFAISIANCLGIPIPPNI